MFILVINILMDLTKLEPFVDAAVLRARGKRSSVVAVNDARRAARGLQAGFAFARRISEQRCERPRTS